ncbi:MAG: hypothetical protein DMD83_16230 [Candidatus Rokuibacteriota bacterium]|nr:MAG: hypothetical protein DMD83_16230 [Candidatus Rokubacteria bacterium]
MKMLTEKTCSEWLATKSVPQAPYSQRKRAVPFYEQVKLPAEALRQTAVARQLVASCEPFGSALLQFTDWPFYKPDEMAVLCGLHTLHGDSRPMIESPGHVFDVAERDLLIGMLSLAMHYGYSAYVYFDHGATLLCWEGGMLDFWCSDELRATEVRRVLRTHAPSSSESADA